LPELLAQRLREPAGIPRRVHREAIAELLSRDFRSPPRAARSLMAPCSNHNPRGEP
jgi:hypothetical protein